MRVEFKTFLFLGGINMKKEFEVVKAIRKLENKNGLDYGFIRFNDKHLFIDHWKEKNKYYTQWKVVDPKNKTKSIGAANVNDEPITVQKTRRDKYLKEIITTQFPDVLPEEVDLFLSEIVNAANQLGSRLFPKDKTKEEEQICRINGFNDYDEPIKEQVDSIFNKDPLKYFLDILDLVHYGDAENKEILLLVLFTKHVENSKPVNVIIVGSSESGKTSLANKTAQITPERFVISTSSMSAKAAYYHEKSFRDDYNHMIINDFLDSPEAIATLKAMTDTEIERPKHMTVSDDKKAVEFEIKGKNTVIVTAARQLTDRELNRRLLHLNPEENEQHVQETKEFIVFEEVGISVKPEGMFELAQALYDKIIEKKYEVYVPWILSLDTNTLSKTDIKHFTNLVKARTLIYQSQRMEILDNVLLSSLEDFQEVARLWRHIADIQRTYLPTKAFEILRILPKWDNETFKESEDSGDGHYGMKINEIIQRLNLSRGAVNRSIWGHDDQRGLADLGYILAIKDGDKKTSPWILYLNTEKPFYGDDKENGACLLNHSEMSKGFRSIEDKKRVISSLCTLLFKKEIIKENNFEDIIESLNHSDMTIEKDDDIMELFDKIKFSAVKLQNKQTKKST